MAALTQDVVRRSRGVGYREVLAIGTSATLFVGSLVARRNTTGRALAATAATGRRILGVAKVLNSTANGPSAGTGVGDTNGTQEVEVEYGNEHLFTIKTALRTNTTLGLNLFVSDDNLAAGTAVGTAAARVVIGRLVAWEASDKSTGWISVGVFGPTNIAV
jgi:hypothetical protein